MMKTNSILKESWPVDRFSTEQRGLARTFVQNYMCICRSTRETAARLRIPQRPASLRRSTPNRRILITDRLHAVPL